MRIVVNGRTRELNAAGNLKNLVEHCSPANTHVIAELNGSIVKRPGWEQTAVKDGDTIELVNLVGGG